MTWNLGKSLTGAVTQSQSYKNVLQKYAANIYDNYHAKVWLQVSCITSSLKSRFNTGVHTSKFTAYPQTNLS